MSFEPIDNAELAGVTGGFLLPLLSAALPLIGSLLGGGKKSSAPSQPPPPPSGPSAAPAQPAQPAQPVDAGQARRPSVDILVGTLPAGQLPPE
jgi:hypothetical protein